MNEQAQRREGHSALRVKDGKLEKFDPHPQRNEQQEWTSQNNAVISPNGDCFAADDKGTAKRLKDRINAALTAERQRREQAERDLKTLKIQHDNLVEQYAKALKQ